MTSSRTVVQAQSTVARALQRIPNVGPAVAGDLMRLGVAGLQDLAGKDPDALYERLCRLDGVRHDPCMRDVFAAIVAQANGEPAQPWWVYSRRRKEREHDDTAATGRKLDM